MKLVKEVVQNLGKRLDLVQCVEAMDKSDQIKGFLLFNKLVLNVQVVVKKLQIHVPVVAVKEKNKHQKRLSVTIPKGVDDGTRIRFGKGEAGSRGGSNGDLYLFINVYSHELFKRSDEHLFLNAQYQLRTQL